MKELVIHVGPFVFKSEVIIKDNDLGTYETVKVPQRDLASFISSQKDITKVHLYGNDKVVRKIEEDCLTKFNVKNVAFSINK